MMNRNRLDRLAHLALWIPIAAYGAIVAHEFFHFADRAVFLSTDDAVANISYALASEGRYGFLSSPVLQNLARDHGLFSYGPFYFYLAAALIWVFGYSLTLVRSIHLAVIIAIALTGRKWFGRQAAGAIGAIVALGLLVTFERGQWPMARPDIMVSFFAVALVVSAGMALRTGRLRYWGAAGLAASCGALTHLVAWSLVPAVIVMLAASFVIRPSSDEPPRPPTRWWRAIVATAAGGAAGAFLFYASFGFRIWDQVEFLVGYRQYTGGMAAIAGSGTTFWGLTFEHFKRAYWYLPYPLEYAVWATLLAGVLLLGLLGSGRVAQRRQHLAMVAPPLIVWVAYLLGLGTYNNFHSGYTILNQVMWLWTLGAIGAVTIEMARPWPAVRRGLSGAAYVLALGLGVGVLTFLAQRTEYRALAAAESVSIREYVDQVLQPIPARATAWGSVAFGIEHPDRIQLVQFDDAVTVMQTVGAAQRAALAPDYLVWGLDENHGNAQIVAGGGGGLPLTVSQLLPALRYTLVSLAAAAPYGVTRVYARADGAPRLDHPVVALYDARLRQWSHALGPPRALPVAEITPVRASQTLRGELEPGTYLLTVAMSAALTSGDSAVVFVAPAQEVRAVPGAFNSELDVSPWFPGEERVALVYRHPGGPFFLSQVGSRAGAMAGVTASRILPLTDYAAARRAPPEQHALPSSQWVKAFPEIQLTPAPAGTIAVVGNTTQYGYQAYGPAIPVVPGQRMTLRVPITVSGGVACLGVLDGTGMRWLVLPDRLLPEYEFQINDSRTVRPVLADCSGIPEGIAPIRAAIGDGSYDLWSDRQPLYVDQLMREFRRAPSR